MLGLGSSLESPSSFSIWSHSVGGGAVGCYAADSALLEIGSDVAICVDRLLRLSLALEKNALKF